MEKTVKYIVIGAGVSGLSFINFVNDNNYIILEKDSTPGGFCKTTYKNGFVWDYSGHFFHFKTDEIKKFFLEKMDQSELTYNNKNTKIRIKDKLIDYPFQKNIHQLDKEDFIECLYELYFRDQGIKTDSFKSMLYSKFGKGITDMFLKPYNEKLYACDLESLDSNAMGRFFPYASVDDIISNFKQNNNSSYNDTFMYHKKGAFAFIQALLTEIDESKIIYNSKVVKVDKEEKKVYLQNGDIYTYEYLICTSSFVDTLNMIDSEQKEFLTYNKVGVYNLGFDSAPENKDIHWIYFPEEKYIFYRVGFYNNILGDERMSLYVEIGHDSKYLGTDDLNRVLDDLRTAGIVKNQKLIDYEYISMSPAYVHINKLSTEFVNYKKTEYENKNIFILGRYGKWEYSSIEDAVLYAKDIATQIGKRK